MWLLNPVGILPDRVVLILLFVSGPDIPDADVWCLRVPCSSVARQHRRCTELDRLESGGTSRVSFERSAFVSSGVSLTDGSTEFSTTGCAVGSAVGKVAIGVFWSMANSNNLLFGITTA